MFHGCLQVVSCPSKNLGKRKSRAFIGHAQVLNTKWLADESLPGPAFYHQVVFLLHQHLGQQQPMVDASTFGDTCQALRLSNHVHLYCVCL